jgi:hypothetical protein
MYAALLRHSNNFTFILSMKVVLGLGRLVWLPGVKELGDTQ